MNQEDDSKINANLQKYENYKEQFGRLNRALNNGFNLEAMFIEYAIMEDRTESLLRHAEKWDAYIKRRRGHTVTIYSKIDYIKKLAENQYDPMHRYFSDGFLNNVVEWTQERNRLIHALVKQQFRHNEISELAEKGKMLVDDLRKRVTNYNRFISRHRVDNK